MTLPIIIYLVGCVLAYVMYKRDMVKANGEWTKGDRTYGILLSLFSWICVIVFFAVLSDYNTLRKLLIPIFASLAVATIYYGFKWTLASKCQLLIIYGYVCTAAAFLYCAVWCMDDN